MKLIDAFASFEDCLCRNPEVTFWWRDDDVGVRGRRQVITNWIINQRLEKMLSLLAAHNIFSIFAVIPYNFSTRGGKQISLLKKYNAYIAIHGIQHSNNSKTNIPSEFPNSEDAQKNAVVIQKYREEFAITFQNNFLQIFVPPWNTMSENLEQMLLSSGLNISKENSQYVKYNENNIDIDVINWNEKELRNEEEILNDIIYLVVKGKKSIGIMGHHRVANGRAFTFFNKLFEIIARHQIKNHTRNNNPWTAKMHLNH